MKKPYCIFAIVACLALASCDLKEKDTTDKVLEDFEISKSDEIQIAKEWLRQLKTDKIEISKPLLFMSSEVNFDGRITTGNNNIRKALMDMRKMFTNPNIVITLSNFKKVDNAQVKQLMTNSKHSSKYILNQDDIESMVIFYLHAIFKETNEENVDGVFLGFDSKKKIVSWFD